MRSITLVHETDLHVPAATAWAVVADYARDPQWRTGVTSMVPTPAGPVEVGTRTAEVLRLAGQTWNTQGVVTGVAPGRSFRWRTTEGADAHGARTVEPLGERTCRVTLELDVTPHGAERLLAPVLRWMLQRNLRRDLAKLAELVAAEDVAHPIA